jgi:hypothetical protein
MKIIARSWTVNLLLQKNKDGNANVGEGDIIKREKFGENGEEFVKP